MTFKLWNEGSKQSPAELQADNDALRAEMVKLSQAIQERTARERELIKQRDLAVSVAKARLVQLDAMRLERDILRTRVHVNDGRLTRMGNRLKRALGQ